MPAARLPTGRELLHQVQEASVSDDLERQLAETHAALEQSEAGAAALREAIEIYLGDVTIDASYLKAVLRENDAGATLLANLHSLRELQRHTVDALQLALADRPRVSLRERLQRWVLQRWEHIE